MIRCQKTEHEHVVYCTKISTLRDREFKTLFAKRLIVQLVVKRTNELLN